MTSLSELNNNTDSDWHGVQNPTPGQLPIGHQFGLPNANAAPIVIGLPSHNNAIATANVNPPIAQLPSTPIPPACQQQCDHLKARFSQHQ